jgi:NAD(P)-dependent dehydrogenase (short-subunit alcohol dehydrogenase family)
MPPFQGKRALIYGAARGIGRAVALEFARRGAQVAIADIDLAGAAETAADVIKLGNKAVSLQCDVLKAESVRAVAEEAGRGLGEFDIVMNNVGAILSGNPEDIPMSEWQRIIGLNLMSVIHSLDVFLPKFIARGEGYIVNTASFAGLYPYAFSRMPYVAAKAAVVALSESLALYLLPKGIRVSCLCPGPVMTRVMEGMKTWSQNAPMPGPGSQYTLKTAEEAAITLADGMRDGRIIIPTDEKVWDVMKHHVESPDQFIHEKIQAFARGDWGTPKR